MIVDLRAATPAGCGGKAGTLGVLLRAGLRVPPGVVVLPDADIDEADLLPFLATIPAGGAAAVRSSATVEDLPDASAAGQHDSFLGVRGAADVAAKVRACRGSLWSDRAVAYRRRHSPAADPRMAVLIQRHIDADVAGVLFTTAGGVRIEASWGLGESVAHGLVTPDAWTVSPAGITGRSVGDKHVRVDRGPGGAVRAEVPPADRARPCLTDEQAHRVTAAGRAAEAVLGTPVDVEWALAGDELWILQARPVTAALPEHRNPAAGATLSGTPGSSGVATGPARVLRGPADFARARPGDIIVCGSTDPAWTPLFGIAAGVVTETGGVLSHAAIVAREHRIPAVLGVSGAMTALRDGEIVTVHGDAGTVGVSPGAAG